MTETNQVIYAAAVLLLLLLGTAFSVAAVNHVQGWKRPLYWLRVAMGAALSTSFGLRLGQAVFGLILPTNTVLYVRQFAFVLVACSLIATPMVDRHEARRLNGSG